MLRVNLANYFCENLNTFSIEECFKIIFVFVQLFKTACNVFFNFKVYKKLIYKY